MRAEIFRCENRECGLVHAVLFGENGAPICGISWDQQELGELIEHLKRMHDGGGRAN